MKYTMTIQQIVKSDIDIFDFDYPIFRDEFREYFEEQFIKYFYLEEIAHETVGQFKLRLESKLNLIMPKYNKLYMTQEIEQRILDNYSITEIFTKDIEGVSTSVSKNMQKDTPKSKIDIDKFDVLSNLSKNEGEGKSVGKENWTRKMYGNIGVQTDADAIVKYWKTIRNITLEIFENELSCLFMGVMI